MDVTKSEGSTRLGAEAMEGLPNNGRNIFNYTTLTPNVAIVQGPDGDEISIGGQKGIHNNVSVDGADFNNPFFGEQRGGQRPAFTFNLDAVQDSRRVGRGQRGIRSVQRRVHQRDHEVGNQRVPRVGPSSEGRRALSSTQHTFRMAFQRLRPRLHPAQFGATFGGPIDRDKAFFFLAYDQQEYSDVEQADRRGTIDPALVAWTDTAFGGALTNDFGSIRRTNEANAFLGKLDFRLGEKHNASLKYNYTRSNQQNGAFNVDSWGRSANALEQDHCRAVNGSLSSRSPRHCRTSSRSVGAGTGRVQDTRARSIRRPGARSPTPTSPSSARTASKATDRHAVLSPAQTT